MLRLKRTPLSLIFLFLILFQVLNIGAFLFPSSKRSPIKEITIEKETIKKNENIFSEEKPIDTDLFKIIESSTSNDIIPILIKTTKETLAKNLKIFRTYGHIQKILNYSHFTGFSAALSKENFPSFLNELPKGIEYIEYNGKAQKTLKDSLQQLRVFPYIRNNYSLKGDENTSIAILDAGMDASHPALKDKVIYWHDYFSTNFTSAVDYRAHGTAIGSIAVGNPYNTTDPEGRTLISERFYYNWSANNLNISESWQYITNSVNITVPGNLTMEGTWFKEDSSTIIPVGFRIYNSSGQTVAEKNTLLYDETYKLTYEINQSNLGLYSFSHIFNLTDNGYDAYGINLTIHMPDNNSHVENSYSGVAPNCKIVALRCITGSTGDLEKIIAAMNWLLNSSNKERYNITGVIMSFKIDSPTVRSLADDLIEAGLVVSCAAGNDYFGSNYAGSNENAPGSADKVISVGAINHNSSITDYSSQGGPNKYNHVIKPDIVAPGGVRNVLALKNTPIYCADSNNGEFLGYNYSVSYEDLQDVIANDTRGVAGTSFAAPFVAGASQLIIQALGGRNNWNYTEEEALFVKNLLLLTATETFPNPRLNVIIENETDFSPTLDRGEKDVHEGYGKLNIDAAIDALLMDEILINSTLNGTLYSIPTNKEIMPYCWARKIYLSRDFYNITLKVPQNADFDLFIYDYQGNEYGEPIIIQKSVNDTLGIDEVLIDFRNDRDDYYFIVVKGVNGSGQFNLSVYTSLTYYDKIAPKATLLLPLNNSFLNETILIRGNATDDPSGYGISKVLIVINTPTRQVLFELLNPSEQFEIAWASKKIDNGNCSIYIIAYDNFTNINYSNVNYIIIFNDNIPPIIIWLSPEDLTTVSGSFMIKAYLSDIHSEVSNATLLIFTQKRTYTYFNALYNGYFTHYFHPNLDEDGACYIRIEAYDSKDNLGESITLLLIIRVGLYTNNAIIFSLILSMGGLLVMNKAAKRIILNDKYLKLYNELTDFIKKPNKKNFSKIQLKKLFEKQDPHIKKINEITFLIENGYYQTALELCDRILQKELKKDRYKISEDILNLLTDIKKELTDKIQKNR